MTGLSETERLARLALFRSESVGPITFYKLLHRFGSAVKSLEALPTMTTKAGRKTPVKIMTLDEASDEVQKLRAFGGDILVYGDAYYPELLEQTEDAPPVLTYIGDYSLLNKNMIAIVGARNASANARRFTQKLAHDLGAAGQVIVSGLARGIDTAAHESALETGTVAVVAGGLDEIYPIENTNLYKAIVEQGCVVSEMPIGTKPTAHHFPRRNRIVSGLSKGTVVVEASFQSGSLITARLASEQGREVFAVPGFPNDPRAAGPNMLIQNGAKLVQNASDILQELVYIGHQKIMPMQASFECLDEPSLPEPEMAIDEGAVQDIIISQLSHTPLDVDDLVRSTALSVSQVQTILLDLEMAGQIHRHPGNRVSRAA